MCMGGGGGDIPRVPERQMAKAPSDPARGRSKDDEARRRGMLATILTSASGSASPLGMGAAAGGASGGKPYLG
jgi:hypothetical protein